MLSLLLLTKVLAYVLSEELLDTFPTKLVYEC